VTTSNLLDFPESSEPVANTLTTSRVSPGFPSGCGQSGAVIAKQVKITGYSHVSQHGLRAFFPGFRGVCRSAEYHGLAVSARKEKVRRADAATLANEKKTAGKGRRTEDDAI